MLLLLQKIAPPPPECGFSRDASTLGKTKEMDSWSGPPTVVHEVVEHIRDVIDCCGWIGVRQDIAECVEGRVPLESVLVQIWYPLCPTANVGSAVRYIGLGLDFSYRRQINVETYCSGARRASVAVWGSLKERPSLLKGTWVSPEVCTYMRYEKAAACEIGFSNPTSTKKDSANQDRGGERGDSHRFRHRLANS